MDNQEYENESECEDYADYGADGYHPVTLGQKFNNGMYTIVQKLGWGHFSTVWLVKKETTNQYCALKIQRSKENHAESALDQLQMLKALRQHENDEGWINFVNEIEALHPNQVNAKLCRPLLLLDSFAHHGIHGKHYCSVFELMGPNLLDVIQHYEFKSKRMPLWLVKKITRDSLLGLVYLHEHCNIIHTDLKPENIMIKLEDFQQKQLIDQIKAYKVKPISMKYLKNIQTSKNSKNKKKNEKKKLKKKLKKEGDAGKQEDQQEEEKQEETPQSQQSSSQKIEEEPQNKSQPSSSAEPSQVKNEQTEHKDVIEVAAESVNEAISKIHQVEKLQQSQKQPQTQKLPQGQVDMSILKWKSVQIKLNDKLYFKLADLGNACFTDKHFTQQIQTREYRSPQVLLGYHYQPNTDIWSLACTVYEMMTNNFLFKPKKISGIRKDQDHLYKIIEVLGPMDKDFALNGKESANFFNKKGKLLNGHPKEQIPLRTLLFQDYGYSEQEAKQAQEFLLPMLAYEPKLRINAKDCLKSAWLWN